MRTAFGGPKRGAELRELRFGPATILELRCDTPNYGQSSPIPVQDALMISLQMRDNIAYDLWEDGQRFACRCVAAR